MARFKCEMNLQNLTRCVGSTCHDGLLAPGMWDRAWRAPRRVEHPETHPHTRGAVGYAEYSSRTLTPGLQLCKECTDTPLWRASQSVFDTFPVHHPCTQELPDKVSDIPVGYSFLHRFDASPVRDRVEVARSVACYDPLVDFPTVAGEFLSDVRHGVVGASVWPESIGMGTKVRFPYWFQDHAKGFLYYPVKQGWDA